MVTRQFSAMADAQMPWVEKYRPKTLSEVTSQSTTTTVLSRSLHNANLPHLLFYGPPGTGKTSTVLALARELYGPRLMKTRVLELNASDERGISIVRERIKNFARLAVSNPTAEDLAQHPCPPYKLVVLDEADSMTNEAQSALRRTMENYAGVTRFCLICNYVTRIIDPLASRCSKFRFRALDAELGLARLQHIASAEGVNLGNDVLAEILTVCEGDLRRGVNLLQCVSTVMGDIKNPNEIKEMFGHVPDAVVDDLVDACQAHDLGALMVFVNTRLVREGYSAAFVLSALHEKLVLAQSGLALSMAPSTKNEVARVLWEADRRVSQGGDETLQLCSCVFQLAKVL